MDRINKITFLEDDHTYWNESGLEVPSVSRILEHFGLTDFSMVRPDVLDASMEFGKCVHKTLELSDKDDLDECDPAIHPYISQWEIFRKDWDFVAIEQPLYSKVFGFAGTIDRVTKTSIIEIKSGQEQPSHALQTAMYQILIQENFKIKVKERLAVYLGKNPKVVKHKDRFDLSIAKSLAQVYGWKKLKKLC